tara:strand:- start:3850 stop:4224 length:375 start_codon:yes stop_codon:yes gene_type:complete
MIKKEKQAYKTIKEVAEILNLINPKNGKPITHTLRYWETEFRQIKPKIFSGRRRYYDENTIQILKHIQYLLKEKGLTIKGVKKHLNNENSKLDEIDNRSIKEKNILKRKLKKISRIVKEIKKIN